VPLRAGLHAGEIELRGQDIGGIAVHAAPRVMAQSQSSEVLVSRVVTDLVAGAGLKFSESGSYELKGLPGRWDLFAASLQAPQCLLLDIPRGGQISSAPEARQPATLSLTDFFQSRWSFGTRWIVAGAQQSRTYEEWLTDQRLTKSMRVAT
jgi:hypothetical protein